MREIKIGENKLLYLNETEELFDVLVYLPDTLLREKLTKNLEGADMKDYPKRIEGMFRYIVTTTYKGNRNHNIFRFAKFIKDLGEDIDKLTREVNSLIIEPLGEKELSKVIWSASK